MDHVINAIWTHYEVYLDILCEEWSTKKYKKFSDCPHYSACKALNDAIYTLEKHYYGKRKTCNLQDEMKYRMYTAPLT